MCAFQPTQRSARPARPTRPANLIAAIEKWWQSSKSKNRKGVGVSPSSPSIKSPGRAANQEQILHLNHVGLKMGEDRLLRGGPRKDGAGVLGDSRQASFDVLRKDDVRSEGRGFRASTRGGSRKRGSFEGGNGHMGRFKGSSDGRQGSSRDLARRPISNSPEYFSGEDEKDMDTRARK